MAWPSLRRFMSIRKPADDEDLPWPGLRGFISSYLHQDADITGGEDPDDRVFYGNIVAEYCRHVTVEKRQAIVAEIDAITAQGTDIPEELLVGMGMEVGLDDQTPREFLLLLRDLFVEHLEDSLAPSLPHDPKADPWAPMRRRRR